MINFWNKFKSWEEAEKSWDQGSKKAAKLYTLKSTYTPLKTPSITPKTAHSLRWKALKHIIKNDQGFKLLRQIMHHPIKYSWRFLRSIFNHETYFSDGNIFYYNLKDMEAFKEALKDPNSILIIGFAYCHKPLECPSKRFSEECLHDPDNHICRQCYLGKVFNSLPSKDIIPLSITTTHYIGEQIFSIVHKNPKKRILFIMTACEMALKMFGDWGNMVNLQGIGVKIEGNVCNTMKAFEVSEQGIKPSLTKVPEDSAKTILDLIKIRSAHH